MACGASFLANVDEFFKAKTVNFGTALRKIVFATGFATCFAVNLVTTQPASAAEPTTITTVLPAPFATAPATEDPELSEVELLCPLIATEMSSIAPIGDRSCNRCFIFGRGRTKA
jgi:hypothetical protein